MKSILLLKNISDLYENMYPWANEGYPIYEKLLVEIPPNEVESIGFVGGGDHLLFALQYFTPQTIINTDVSPIALMSTITKLATILGASYSEWIELLDLSLSWEKVVNLISNTKMNEVFDMCKNYTNAFENSVPLTVNLPLLKSAAFYDKVKDNLTKVTTFGVALNSIWTLELIPPCDLFLSSNAYNYTSKFNVNNLLRKGGYLVSTERDRKYDGLTTISIAKGLTNSNGWDGYLFKNS